MSGFPNCPCVTIPFINGTSPFLVTAEERESVSSRGQGERGSLWGTGHYQATIHCCPGSEGVGNRGRWCDGCLDMNCLVGRGKERTWQNEFCLATHHQHAEPFTLAQTPRYTEAAPPLPPPGLPHLLLPNSILPLIFFLTHMGSPFRFRVTVAVHFHPELFPATHEHCGGGGKCWVWKREEDGKTIP